MKKSFSLNQVLATAVVCASSVVLAAVSLGFSGLIEMQCSPNDGCRVVIDGRS